MRTLAKVVVGCALVGALLGITSCGYDHEGAIPQPTSTQKSPWGDRPAEPSTEKVVQALKLVNACRALTKQDVELAFEGIYSKSEGPKVVEGSTEAECTYFNTTSGGAVKVRIRYDPRGEAYAAAEQLADTTGREPSESLGDHGEAAKALYNSDGHEVVFLFRKYYVSLLVTTDHDPRDQLVALAQLVLLNLNDQLED